MNSIVANNNHCIIFVRYSELSVIMYTLDTRTMDVSFENFGLNECARSVRFNGSELIHNNSIYRKLAKQNRFTKFAPSIHTASCHHIPFWLFAISIVLLFVSFFLSLDTDPVVLLCKTSNDTSSFQHEHMSLTFVFLHKNFHLTLFRAVSLSLALAPFPYAEPE